MGGTRRPGPEGTRGAAAATEDGTLARRRADVPGSTGSKGGSSKQGIVTDRRWLFVDEMRTALARPSIPHSPPGRTLLREYFGHSTVLAQTAYRQCQTFYRYAGAFYVHVIEVSPGTDITYPGPGHICDRWSDFNRLGTSGNRRVIDCEGFAFLASELLPPAGWTLDGYRLAHHRDDASDFHIAAQLSRGEEAAFVGGPRPTADSMANEARRAFRPEQFIVIDEVFATQLDARTRATALANP